ncbi:hypothetical protein D6C98_05860 [Aureobasidium pullulans]|uniref:NAD(P)-binding protein n=1 Tax=Aureobasidium pullulans TaxID=5580 RepID=A0A4S9N4C9_AURPU|nr:hypothetical protein D6D12_09331 [Aureobasidium pullulans]THX99993.1 hypothetical protein D6D03_06786 [Aureobasidium pullulans]THY50850.1 hypothetical protein D6C98_05860 [Aureobasidium pullulans]TIA84236.1 hypothetical protein D6C76_01751 [Aureobasidium pullulans]
MSPSDKIAIIGHNGWAAQAIVKSLATQAFTAPLRVLARDASSIASLPDNVEVARYSWDREDYMGIDIVNNRILHTGKSRENPVWLCSRDYVAAGSASLFFLCSASSLAGRTIGLNELHPTTWDIESALHKKAGVPPRVAFDSVQNATDLAKADRLDALVRKKMGDGTHNVGQDMWEVEGYRKRTLDDFISGEALEDPKYIKADEKTRHFLDHYFP